MNRSRTERQPAKNRIPDDSEYNKLTDKPAHNLPYKPPLPSRATRRFARRSKISMRGYLFAKFGTDDRVRRVTFESGLERSVLLILLNNPNIANIWEQPPAVQFIGPDGRPARHTFDFLLTLIGGDRLAVAVKPAAKVQQSNFRTVLAHIRRSLSPQFADEVLLVTDHSFPRSALREAENAYYEKFGALIGQISGGTSND